ncbi:MAG: FAD-binding oxidoreductase [candidate division Zixibacteria bacterium]|nr:FAD-binding oxidoreductase [candidate division Zixibacteria bacterium]
MTVPYWFDQSKQNPPVEADIAIIGGGIMGVSLLYWLSKNKDIKVVLLEKNRLASAASGRNAGFLIAGLAEHYNRAREHLGKIKARQIWQLSLDNHQLLREEIIEKNKLECEYQRCGSYLLACSEVESKEIKETVELLNQDGFEVELINERKINQLLKSQRFHNACFSPKDGALNPVKLIEGIKDIIKSNDNIFEEHEVMDLEMTGNSKVKIRTNQRTFLAQMVVLATNAYSRSLFGVFKDLVIPTRGQILATEPVKEKLFDQKIIYADWGYEYFRQLLDGTILLGGFRQLYSDTEIGFSDETTPEIQEGLYKFLIEHFPQLDKIKMTHRWAGVMGFSKDGLPLVGALPQAPFVICAVGFTGHGLGFAFGLAKGLAEYLIQGKTSYPLDIFSLKRVL